uniref:GH18 domain-containing protein n=1 Tax=Mola mola TaxID=94237 RepID=A0A3Q4B4S0_MOLML
LSEAYEADSNGGSNAQLMPSAAVKLRFQFVYFLLHIILYLDFISVKTYDLHDGQDGVTAHQSSLYTENNAYIDYIVRYWLDREAPAGKILLGFMIILVRRPASPGPYTQQIALLYRTCSFLRVAYTMKGNHWVRFDNQRSYEAKVQYTTWPRKHLGDAAVWTLDMDDFSGQFCGHVPLPTTFSSTSKWGKTSPPSLSTQSTQQQLTTAKLDIGCFQNITVVYPVSSFCTHRAHGLYLASHKPKMFYRCVQSKMYVRKCQALRTEPSSVATISPLKDMNIVGFLLASLLCLWGNWWFNLHSLLTIGRRLSYPLR